MIWGWQRFVVVLFFWLLEFFVAAYGFLHTFFYSHLARLPRHPTALHFGLSIAKLGAFLANLNAALLILSMCRALLTRISMTRIVRVLDLDLLLPLHRWSSYMLVLGGLIHVAAHLMNGVLLAVNWAHQTLVIGYILVLLIFLIACTAYIRSIKIRTFEVFRYIHYLWFPTMILLILHGQFCFLRNDLGKCVGSTTIYWVGISLIFSLLDSFYVLRRTLKFAYISKVIQHPSNVYEVQIKKPNFIFLSGQHLYLNVPAISRLQWHPFTITSAPEEDHLSIHVRIVGDWTKALHTRLLKPRLEYIRLYVDGPYGSACQNYEKYTSIICIGAGIGQTPFASILKSLWFRLNRPISPVPFKAIHFVGICRSPAVS